jgi:hypothetical protein
MAIDESQLIRQRSKAYSALARGRGVNDFTNGLIWEYSPEVIESAGGID